MGLFWCADPTEITSCRRERSQTKGMSTIDLFSLNLNNYFKILNKFITLICKLFVMVLQGMCFCQFVLHSEQKAQPPTSIVQTVKGQVASVRKNALKKSHTRRNIREPTPPPHYFRAISTDKGIYDSNLPKNQAYIWESIRRDGWLHINMDQWEARMVENESALGSEENSDVVCDYWNRWNEHNELFTIRMKPWLSLF